LALSMLGLGLHLWALYRPVGPPVLRWFPDADKIAHAAGFAVPLLLILLTMSSRSRHLGQAISFRWLVITVGLFAGHALLSEWIQHRFYDERSGDPLDVLADWLGCVLGVLVYRMIIRRAGVRQVEAGAA